jgi:Short C-terminal domain
MKKPDNDVAPTRGLHKSGNCEIGFRATGKIRAAIALASIVGLVGCAISSPIEPAKTSKSRFDSALLYKGKTTIVGPGTPGSEQYRVFEQGATGFVPLQAVRETAEQRAQEFCRGKGLSMESITERDSTHIPAPGKFPRVEIVFDCIAIPPVRAENEDPKYTKLRDLKRLLDSGALTQAEFDREKAKILSQP